MNPKSKVDCGGTDCAPCLYSKRHCSNGVVDDDEDQLDCGGFDCELCKLDLEIPDSRLPTLNPEILNLQTLNPKP